MGSVPTPARIRRRRAGERRRGGLVSRVVGPALGVLLSAAAPRPTAAWGAEPEADALEPADPHANLQQLGWEDSAIWISPTARQRVRGDRPEGASIHLAFASPIVDPDASLRDELRRFESQTLGEDASIPRSTIAARPPEPWMEALAKPDLPVRWNGRLVEFLRHFKDDPAGRRLVAAWMQRVGRYEVQIRRVLREVGVPEDLLYVAMVESGLNPEVQSPVGAAGLWQFMDATGRVYGLESDYWHDDRLDVERSTYAAAAYLKDLHTRFGSWELALAAYNAGYGLVVKTIRENNTNNFWALCEIENGLPTQTVNYVAKIVAVSLVARNRQAFGIGETREPPIVAAVVDVPPGTRLADVARELGLEEKQLARLNAALVRGRTDPKGTTSRIRVPRDSLAAFEGLGPKLRAERQRYTTHTVRLGESLAEIAALYGITESRLRQLNAVHDGGEVVGGVALVVPKVGEGSATATNPPPLVAVPALTVPDGRRLVFLPVTRAATPRLIASAFDLGWDEIVHWNDLDPTARLVDGQVLQILVPAGFVASAAEVKVLERGEVELVLRGSEQHLDALLARRDLKRRGYKVKKGDSMARIAKRFDLSHGSLARINGVRREHKPKEGEVLVVYVGARKTAGTIAPPPPVATALTAEIAEFARTEAEQASPSTAETAKLPGDDDERRGAGESSEAGEGSTSAGAAGERDARAPSTPETSRVPGKKTR